MALFQTALLWDCCSGWCQVKKSTNFKITHISCEFADTEELPFPCERVTEKDGGHIVLDKIEASEQKKELSFSSSPSKKEERREEEIKNEEAEGIIETFCTILGSSG